MQSRIAYTNLCLGEISEFVIAMMIMQSLLEHRVQRRFIGAPYYLRFAVIYSSIKWKIHARRDERTKSNFTKEK